MSKILRKLAGTDRRSIGRSNEVVSQILDHRAPFAALIRGMIHDDPVIRMRCADAAEKVSARHPEYLQPHARTLIDVIAKCEQQEVRWHVAQMLPRLELAPAKRKKAYTILEAYLRDESRIVKTFAMQALVDLAENDAPQRARVRRRIETLMRTGSPAMKARGRKLVARMKKWLPPGIE